MRVCRHDCGGLFTARAENPYNAAQRFLQNNELPLSYLDEVVKFIEKSTAGVNIGTGGDQFVDPFTGELRVPRP